MKPKALRPADLLITFCTLLMMAGNLTLSVASLPNILLIVSDDQGYRDLGCFGSPEIKTPHLDRLASGGVRLTSFYVTWPACTPSRGSLLTGRFPQRNGTYDMYRNEAPDYDYLYKPEEYRVTFERIGGMDLKEVLLPKVLRSGGYRSGIYGKWDLGIRHDHQDEVFVNNGRRTRTAKMVAFNILPLPQHFEIAGIDAGCPGRAEGDIDAPLLNHRCGRGIRIKLVRKLGIGNVEQLAIEEDLAGIGVSLSGVAETRVFATPVPRPGA